ncbi:hypothetical protein DYBT9275_05793 [Dyadobacter sp. CECT 9275]|uniref:Glycosyltransferase 2-like domain-containing protein n=1 Tax=Dyadobacter helix TaxID=2822344 RepID=A0A916N7L9_9BACT|nr:glycosyltransferase [Dyadobacter sp. CECT 9275]CAG5017539.1 hypothetical protein DYBT9275_05793 [Dyadobacter sp. CECT 9275]
MKTFLWAILTSDSLALLCAIVLGSYTIFTLLLTFLWKKIQVNFDAAETGNDFISVIVPVRNEAQNIRNLLTDLQTQTFPQNRFEVLIMNDGSSDETEEIVRAFIQTHSCDVKLITPADDTTKSPKKRAIERGVAIAKGNLIVTTDGDCRMGSAWLHTIGHYHHTTGAKLISGPVTFEPERTITDHLQAIEFASLVASGAASIQAGYPSMCNGANLCYEKSAFMEVNGFEGVNHIASGDDEFLMHKIAAKFPEKIRFLKHQSAIVYTKPHRNWSSFFRQRKRWASKWKHYQSRTPLFLALYIFLSNFSLLMATVLFFMGEISNAQLAGLWALKCIPEWIFLGSVLSFLQKKRSVYLIPLTQLIYPLYVCFFGLAAQKKSYEWKGRKLT